jgi:hypothetical protein
MKGAFVATDPQFAATLLACDAWPGRTTSNPHHRLMECRRAARGAAAGCGVIVREDRAVETESPTVSVEAAFAADAVNELLDFVAHDPQFARLGLRGAITLVLCRRLGGAPSEETVSLMSQAFWDAWEDRFCEFERSPPRAPR